MYQFFFSIEVNDHQNCLVLHILQNIFIHCQQKKTKSSLTELYLYLPIYLEKNWTYKGSQIILAELTSTRPSSWQSSCKLTSALYFHTFIFNLVRNTFYVFIFYLFLLFPLILNKESHYNQKSFDPSLTKECFWKFGVSHDIHPSSTDYQKRKTVEWGLGSIHRLLIGFWDVCDVQVHLNKIRMSLKSSFISVIQLKLWPNPAGKWNQHL